VKKSRVGTVVSYGRRKTEVGEGVGTSALLRLGRGGSRDWGSEDETKPHSKTLWGGRTHTRTSISISEGRDYRRGMTKIVVGRVLC